MAQYTLDTYVKDEETASQERDGQAEEPPSKPSLKPPKPKAEMQKAERKVTRNPDGTLKEIVKAPDGPRITIYKRPGVRLFKEPVKCPLTSCNVYFASDYDLRCHLETHWQPLKNGGGEWIRAEAYPHLRRALLNAEYIIQGKREYRLSTDGKVIFRRERRPF